ncbi:hypothetical protein SAMN04487977_11092 [Treponema bryantii]|uniref:Uncharacterized protein n=1 Tax=Treponema bryantii TaxID=163 RepID=A0A1H9IT83_9SPIR|nr:hypothetical protein [Treponema bryantii]SEQ77625.1 hypothetical protein SAMN04487977_11092 [Treponema bryantii]
MNLDKKLAKYARHIENPKYYKKIYSILEKGKRTNYKFKDFNDYDMVEIYARIKSFFEVNDTPEKQKRVIEYFNKIWIIVSDKHYILAETPYLWIALSVYIRCYLFLFWSKFTRLINPSHFFECNNVESELYLLRGALKAAEYLGCEVVDLDEYRLI